MVLNQSADDSSLAMNFSVLLTPLQNACIR